MPEVNTFAGATLDRVVARRRDTGWVRERLTDPASRAVVVGETGALVAEGTPVRPALRSLVGVDADATVLLGCSEGGPRFAVDADDLLAGSDGRPPDGTRMAGLRDVAGELDQADGGLVAYASALVQWRRANRFCGRCGAPTGPREAGHLLVCSRHGHAVHPRTDPVVIMVVVDGDRALLGRQARWPAGRHSALAGFVEPGESLEEAVAREVAEETGVAVARPRYRSSQPWPFPASLMLGFVADYAGGDVDLRDGELEGARWFARDELRTIARDPAAAEGGRPHLPPREAIARRLIDGWLAAG